MSKRVPKTIDQRWLRRRNVCDQSLYAFRRVFGAKARVEITGRNVSRFLRELQAPAHYELQVQRGFFVAFLHYLLVSDAFGDAPRPSVQAHADERLNWLAKPNRLDRDGNQAKLVRAFMRSYRSLAKREGGRP